MRHYVFTDEAGDFNFTRNAAASRYYIVCAVCMDSPAIQTDLLEIRRRLNWDGIQLKTDSFHATYDSPIIRTQVFDLLEKSDFTVYAQIMEKSKAQPHVKESPLTFYRIAWTLLFKYAMRRIVKELDDQVMVTTASINTKATRGEFATAIREAVSWSRIVDPGSWRTTSCPAAADPCLQVADYCAWAIQRKYERNDREAYRKIAHKIVYEFDTWSRGTQHYY